MALSEVRVFAAKDSLRETLRKTLISQTVLTLVAALLGWLTKSDKFALALVYGGAVTMAGTWLHGWRLSKISAGDESINPGLVGAEVLKGSILKFAAIIGLLALGMGKLKLDPLGVLVGFIIAYLGFLTARGYAPRSKPGN